MVDGTSRRTARRQMEGDMHACDGFGGVHELHGRDDDDMDDDVELERAIAMSLMEPHVERHGDECECVDDLDDDDSLREEARELFAAIAGSQQSAKVTENELRAAAERCGVSDVADDADAVRLMLVYAAALRVGGDANAMAAAEHLDDAELALDERDVARILDDCGLSPANAT